MANVVEAPVAAASREPQRKWHEKAVAFGSKGIKIAGVVAIKLVTRTLAWGSFGVAVGAVVWTLLYVAGVLEIDWPPWRYLVWVLLLLYLVAGGGALGYVGVWRGLGRAVIYLGVELGFVIYLIEQILDRTMTFMRASGALSRAMDASEQFAGNIPLQRWEDGLKRSVAGYLGEPDEISAGLTGLRRGITRRIKAFLCRKIEIYLLKIVRQEVDAQGGGGGVSMARVREVALDLAEGYFVELIKGVMNKYLLIGSLILVAFFAIAPVVACFC
jgi:hypothetical protein